MFDLSPRHTAPTVHGAAMQTTYTFKGDSGTYTIEATVNPYRRGNAECECEPESVEITEVIDASGDDVGLDMLVVCEAHACGYDVEAHDGSFCDETLAFMDATEAVIRESVSASAWSRVADERGAA